MDNKMKSSGLLQIDAMFHCLCDLMTPIEASKQRCKVMVCSQRCYEMLKKEDMGQIREKGDLPMVWGMKIYIRDKDGFYVDLYGGDCSELLVDYPEIEVSDF